MIFSRFTGGDDLATMVLAMYGCGKRIQIKIEMTVEQVHTINLPA
jgi:hypothetical protein